VFLVGSGLLWSLTLEPEDVFVSPNFRKYGQIFGIGILQDGDVSKP